jgi:hypothetical protein
MTTMSSSQFGAILAAPATDKDTEMLSDNGLLDDFEIEVDDPSPGDHDDFMLEDFEPDANIPADAEMAEDDEHHKLNETEMVDENVEEDEDMLNFDFTEPEHNIVSTDDPMIGSELETQAALPHTSDFDPATVEVEVNDIDAKDIEDPPTAGQVNEEVVHTDNLENTKSVIEAAEETAIDEQKESEPEAAEAVLDSNTVSDPPRTQEPYVEGANAAKELTKKEEAAHEEDDVDHFASITEQSLEAVDVTAATSEPQGTKAVAKEEEEASTNVETNNQGNEQAGDNIEYDESEHFTDYSYDMIVHYKGNQLSLFPPSRPELPETYLLNDQSLAEKTFTDLFAACRTVLGESISDQEALELEIPVLGLYIHEVSNP